MYLFSNDNGKVGIECDGCGKVYTYNRKYFSYVSDTMCINNTLLQCPGCYKEAKSNTKIFAKEKSTIAKKDSQSTSSGAIIATVIVMGLIIGLIFLIVSCVNNTKTQYEIDLENGMNKQWDDMSRGEKEAVQDYIEWYIEQEWD